MAVVALFAGLGFKTAYSAELMIRNTLKSSFSITVNSAVNKDAKQRKSGTKTIKSQQTQIFKTLQENKHIWVTMKKPALQWSFNIEHDRFQGKKDITIVGAHDAPKLSINEIELIGVTPVK